jgi:hypothetical protein
MSEERYVVTAEPPDVLPWNESFENFFPVDVLERIHSSHPDILSEEFSLAEAEIKAQVLAELTEHGDYRRAAILLPKFFEGGSEKERKLVEEKVGALVLDDLINEDVLSLPGNAEEFRKYFSGKGFSVELLVDL